MRSSVSAHLLAAAWLLAVAHGAPARAEESLIWTAKASDGFVSLNYGPLDPAKAPLFLLSCFDAMGIAVLNLRQEVEGAKPGDPIPIVLSAGAAKAELKGEAMRDEAGGATFAEVSDIAVKPLLKVLREAGPVTLASGNASASLTDSGRLKAVEQFSKDCPLE